MTLNPKAHTQHKHTPCWYILFDPRTENARVLTARIESASGTGTLVKAPSLDRADVDYPDHLPALRLLSNGVRVAYQTAIVYDEPPDGQLGCTHPYLVIAMVVVGVPTKAAARKVVLRELDHLIEACLSIDAGTIQSQFWVLTTMPHLARINTRPAHPDDHTGTSKPKPKSKS